MRRPWHISFAVAGCAGALVAACSLSPQPLPPGETFDGGAKNTPMTPGPGDGTTPSDGGAFGADSGPASPPDAAGGGGDGGGGVHDAAVDAPGDARNDGPDASGDAGDAGDAGD